MILVGPFQLGIFYDFMILCELSSGLRIYSVRDQQQIQDWIPLLQILSFCHQVTSVDLNHLCFSERHTHNSGWGT